MKRIQNWLGEYMEFEGSLGQAIANHKIHNLPGGYIYDDGFINLSADPEIPIKGLIILGTNRTFSSINEFSDDERLKIYNVSNSLIETFHDIGFKKIIQYQDEGTSGQFHIWFLPRHDWTYKFGNNLDDMINFAQKNLNISDEYRQSLIECISTIKSTFNN